MLLIVMACIYIPTKFLGGVKIFAIALIFILVTIFLTLFFLRSHVAENWDQYKCHPLIMPFSEMFGFDSGEVLASCVGYSARKSSKQIKEEAEESISSMNMFLNELSTAMTHLQSQIDDGNIQTENEFKDYFDKLNNTTSTMEYLGVKIKTIFYKITAIYTTLLYAAYSMVQGVDGIVQDKALNKAIDFIIDPTKDMKNFGDNMDKAFKAKSAKKFGTKTVKAFGGGKKKKKKKKN